MSGGFGWSNNNKPRDPEPTPYDYGQAVKTHTVKVVNPQPIMPVPSLISQHFVPLIVNKSTIIAKSIPIVLPAILHGARHSLKSSAENVIIVSLDLTGSLNSWKDEIFKRMSTLFVEAQQYLGEDLQILFIGHGDCFTDCKEKGYPLQVTQFGSGPELENYLQSLSVEGIWGGGNKAESSELIAYYIDSKIDLTVSKKIFTVFITDEPGRDYIDANYVERYLGLHLLCDEDTIDVFARLLVTSEVFNIFCQTSTAKANPQFKTWWENMLSPERVVFLDDSRRVVDIILGIIASVTNQNELFDELLLKKQQGTQHQEVNVATVQKSLSFLRSSINAFFRCPSTGKRG